MTTWKQAEREIAKRLGGIRQPVNGRGLSADIAHQWMAPEVKHRDKAFPKWITKAHEQAEQAAKHHPNADKFPILPVSIIHQKGQPYDDCMVQIRLSDFVSFFVK